MEDTIPLSGPVEMNHEQITAKLSEALDRKIVFEDRPIEDSCKSLRDMGAPARVIQHLGGAMPDYKRGGMSGADRNFERLAGRGSITVGEFAQAHADIRNAA